MKNTPDHRFGTGNKANHSQSVRRHNHCGSSLRYTHYTQDRPTVGWR